MIHKYESNIQNSLVLNSISDVLKEYYGVSIGEDKRKKIVEKVFDEICKGDLLLPSKYNIMYKGKVVKAFLGNFGAKCLFSIRHNSNRAKFTTEDWENCLLPYSDKLAYCKENESIYIGIQPDIADYLDKHDSSGVIYDIVCGTRLAPFVRG